MTKGKHFVLICTLLLFFQGTCSRTVPPPSKGAELSFWTVGGGSKSWIGEERLLVPVVDAAAIKPVLPLLEKLGKEMAEIVFSDYSVILDAFRSSPYSTFLQGAGDYIQVCYHAFLSLVVGELVQKNVIPPIPKPVPEHFGAYITLGSVFE